LCERTSFFGLIDNESETTQIKTNDDTTDVNLWAGAAKAAGALFMLTGTREL
jgi:hypothetical protein